MEGSDVDEEGKGEPKEDEKLDCGLAIVLFEKQEGEEGEGEEFSLKEKECKKKREREEIKTS